MRGGREGGAGRRAAHPHPLSPRSFDAEHVERRARDVVRLLEVAGVAPGPVEAVRGLILATTKEGGGGTRRQAAATAAAAGHPGHLGGGGGAGGHGADDSGDDAEEEDDEEEGGRGDGEGEAAAPAAAAAAPAAPAPSGATVPAVPAARAGAGTDIILGMVGHPNVGKSSVINTVCAAKRVSVSRTAGHTKRAQTIPVVPGVQLLDCPGLVFPRALIARPGAAAARAAADPAPAPAAVHDEAAAAPAPGRPVVQPRAMTQEERAAAALARQPGAAVVVAADATAPLPAYLSHGAAAAAVTSEAVERAMQQLCGVISLAQVGGCWVGRPRARIVLAS